MFPSFLNLSNRCSFDGLNHSFTLGDPRSWRNMQLKAGQVVGAPADSWQYPVSSSQLSATSSSDCLPQSVGSFIKARTSHWRMPSNIIIKHQLHNKRPGRPEMRRLLLWLLALAFFQLPSGQVRTLSSAKFWTGKN